MAAIRYWFRGIIVVGLLQGVVLVDVYEERWKNCVWYRSKVLLLCAGFR